MNIDEIIAGRYLILGFTTLDQKWFDLISSEVPPGKLPLFIATQEVLLQEALKAVRIRFPKAEVGWIRGFKSREERDRFRKELEKELDRIAIRGDN